MDPRHPHIALIANGLGIIFSLGTLFSWVLPYVTPRGWGIEETVMLILAPAMFGLAWWGRQDHELLTVHETSSSAEQYEALQDLPIMVSLDNPEEFVNPNTAAVIASIIGVNESQQVGAVATAIDTLSSGEIGAASAAAVAHNKVEHALVNIENTDDRTVVVERSDFATDGLTSVPLPIVEPLELPELPSFDSVPAMPDLDELLAEETTVLPPLDLPELPDF
jgi:hypothetical protein